MSKFEGLRPKHPGTYVLEKIQRTVDDLIVELPYRVTSLIKKRPPQGSYSRTMPRALWEPKGGLRFLMSEVSLYTTRATVCNTVEQYKIPR